MDNSKIIQVLEANERRLVGLMEEANPATSDYTTMMENLIRSRSLAAALQRHPNPYVMPEMMNVDPEAAKQQKEDAIKSVISAAKKAKTNKPTEELKTEEPKAEQADGGRAAEGDEADADTETAPEPQPGGDVKPCPKPEHKLTKAEVRTALSAYANAGADVATVMQGMGYAKLSDVPEDKYPELLEAAKKAVQ